MKKLTFSVVYIINRDKQLTLGVQENIMNSQSWYF